MNAPLYLKLQNSHTINITKAYSPKTMRQRNPAGHILPTEEENVCIVYVTMGKKGRSIFEWGMHSATRALSDKAGLKRTLKLNT